MLFHFIPPRIFIHCFLCLDYYILLPVQISTHSSSISISIKSSRTLHMIWEIPFYIFLQNFLAHKDLRFFTMRQACQVPTFWHKIIWHFLYYIVDNLKFTHIFLVSFLSFGLRLFSHSKHIFTLNMCLSSVQSSFPIFS